MRAQRKRLLLLLCVLGFGWGKELWGEGDNPSHLITDPPAELASDPFYKKYLNAEGLPILASDQVPDEALFAAERNVNQMLEKRPDIRKTLIRNHVRVAVLSEKEVTTDIPEYRDLTPKDYWDDRARGLGATADRPVSSGAEENLLGYPDDRYRGENIFLHEFAHTIHLLGLNDLDENFDQELKRLYERAIEAGLWTNTYAAANHEEYWAEGVQSWFDCNLEADPPDGIHNEVNTRRELRRYDPDLASLIEAVF